MNRIFIIVFLYPIFLFSQNEYFVYCDNGILDTIVKVDEVIHGDTVVKTYKDPLYANQTFNYYIYNDSIFSKYQGEYYLIGANQAEIGDIWEPAWYSLISYTDVVQDCSDTRTLEVVNKDNINFDGEIRAKYTLKVLDINPEEFPYADSYFTFIEGIGAVDGGPYYNLASSASCTDCSDCQEAVFITYHNGGENYDGDIDITECSTVGLELLSENNVIITYKIVDEVLFIDGIEGEVELTIYDLMGRKLKSSSQNQVDVSDMSGIYFVHINHKKATNSLKIYF